MPRSTTSRAQRGRSSVETTRGRSRRDWARPMLARSERRPERTAARSHGRPGSSGRSPGLRGARRVPGRLGQQPHGPGLVGVDDEGVVRLAPTMNDTTQSSQTGVSRWAQSAQSTVKAPSRGARDRGHRLWSPVTPDRSDRSDRRTGSGTTTPPGTVSPGGRSAGASGRGSRCCLLGAVPARSCHCGYFPRGVTPGRERRHRPMTPDAPTARGPPPPIGPPQGAPSPGRYHHRSGVRPARAHGGDVRHRAPENATKVAMSPRRSATTATEKHRRRRAPPVGPAAPRPHPRARSPGSGPARWRWAAPTSPSS